VRVKVEVIRTIADSSRHSEPFAPCHSERVSRSPEPFTPRHSEGEKRLKNLAQGKLREGEESHSAQGDKINTLKFVAFCCLVYN